MSTPFKSGYIAIVGRPNVGKSTLLNALIGQKIAAVCSKPQTTRHRILGIKHRREGQLLFLDTPGIHKPHKSLNEYMMEVAKSVIDDADLFLFMVEPAVQILEADREIFEMIFPKKKPIILIINKIDKFSKEILETFQKQVREAFSSETILMISAAVGVGLDLLEKEILKKLPEGPPYFPADEVTDQTERFLAAEIIREKVMQLMRQEIPYAATVQIEAYEEPRGGDAKKVTRIRALLIAEKESQKGMLIGKGGQMIKKIGELARHELEIQIGNQVYLELFVRIEKDWTKDPQKVQAFNSPL